MAQDLLRIVACGSVDDGKSTLIGRLLADVGRVPDDERAALARASASHGTRGDDIDYALLLDGLDAEREQGITIDVAWRHLETPRRRFLIADCPGHVQYTRNMATGASRADLAIMLVDATRGLLPQTLRHTAIAALFGIRHVLLAVNKMDRVGHDRGVFEAIAGAYRTHAAKLGITGVTAIPLAAATGENIATPAATMPWYAGPTVLDHLHDVEVPSRGAQLPARLPVQLVLRGGGGERWLAGTLASGTLRVGDALHVQPAGVPATVAALHRAGVEATSAHAGDAIAVRLAEDVDAARGDVLVPAAAPLAVSDQFGADLLWFDAAPLLPGRRYLLKLGTRVLGVRIGEIRHLLDPESLQPLAAKRLQANDIGEVTLSLDAVAAFAPYADDPVLGAFVLADTLTNATVGAGMIRHGLRRADNIHWQLLDVDRDARAALKGQRPRCVWFTGFSGAGKSTIANALMVKLMEQGGRPVTLLDGDVVRKHLSSELGFSKEHRDINIKRIGYVASEITKNGGIAICAPIAPYTATRRAVREMVEAGGAFVEVHVATPLEECERRDRKGLYKLAREGKIKEFTGISDPYEAPTKAELVMDTEGTDVDSCAHQVILKLESMGLIKA